MPSTPGNVETIGKYHVIRPVSEGRGFGGQVYLADDPDAAFDERAFLIKLLDVRGLERAKALRELRQARRLKHDTVASLVEYFEHGRQLAVVFEILEGLWLDQAMDTLEQRDERLSLPCIWRIGACVAGALAAAHTKTDDQGRVQHISHGHLGPDHVHVSWQGEVWVFGIGLGSALGDVERGARARGSLAPEQLRKGFASGAQADVYGVGAMVWSLLSGEPAAPGQALARVAEVRDGVTEPVASGIDLAVKRAISARRINCQQLEERFDNALSGDGVDELRESLARLRSAQPPGEAGDAAAPGPAPVLDDEADLPLSTSPRPGDSSDDDVRDGEAQGRPKVPRPRSSAPEDDGGSKESLARRVGARKAAPSGPGAAADGREPPTIPAEGSDPPDQDDKPGPGSVSEVHDESVVARISSLFDDLEGEQPNPDAKPREPAADPAARAAASAEPAADEKEALPVGASGGAGDSDGSEVVADESDRGRPTTDEAEPSPVDDLDDDLDLPVAKPDDDLDLPVAKPDEELDLPVAKPAARGLALAPAASSASDPMADLPVAKPAKPSGGEPLAKPGASPVASLAEPDAAADTAPAAPAAEIPVSPRRGVSPVLAALLALGVGAVGFAAAWFLKPAEVVTTPPATTAPAAPRPPLPASASAPAAKPSLSAPVPLPSAAPTGEADAGPVDGAATEEDPDGGELPAVDEPADAGDGSELLSYEGYLTVRSRVAADVYVQGIHVGTTNRKLKSRCRQRFIRLRDSASGKWLTKGDPVRILCMSSTTVTIDPPAP
ncbi:MAG: hypothetical protein JRI68_29150 [Deltaproteobacteria bacterium]|nr:hypothetical protein [Deltaproteobacteria bacterium]